MEMFEQMKKEIIKELEESGKRVIPSYYNGGEKLIKLINKFDETQSTYKDKVDKINKRYSKEVAQEKIKELDLELIADKTSLKYDLDAILSDELNLPILTTYGNVWRWGFLFDSAIALSIHRLTSLFQTH